MKAAVLWNAREAVRQTTTLWQDAQSRPSAPWWKSSWQWAQSTGSVYLTAVPCPAGKSAVSLRWHAAQAIVACLPAKNSAVSFRAGCTNFSTWKEAVPWQVSQRCGSWPRCGSLWHVRHSVEIPVSLTAVPLPAGNAAVAFVWHFAQGTVSCLPVSVNFARECSKRSGLKPFVARPWHLAQSEPTWPRCGSLWQAAHSKETPRYFRVAADGARPFTSPPAEAVSATWHFSQATPACAPAKNSGRRGCWNPESLNDVVPWHVSQVAPSLPLWGSAWHEAHTAFAPRKSTVRCASGTRRCAAAALWQAAQGVVACLPSRGNFVRWAWSNFAGAKPLSVWQAAQSSAPKTPL